MFIAAPVSVPVQVGNCRNAFSPVGSLSFLLLFEFSFLIMNKTVDPYIDQTAGFIQPTSFVPVYRCHYKSNSFQAAYIPSYPPQVAYCYPAPQRPAQLPPVSRKRSSSSGSVEESKREHSASDTTCSLRVYMSYLRQQYAFYPRWWYLFRLLVSVIQSNSQENRSLYIYVLQILLAGRKKERKLLASYLNVEFDKSKQTAFDQVLRPRPSCLPHSPI